MTVSLKRVFTIASILLVAFATSVSATIIVDVDDSSAGWLGFMNVSNLPAPDGDGAYQFGSGWGVGDLNATFDDGASKLTLSPNTIGDPAEYWYIGGGAPGNPGNKIMEANLFQEFGNGTPELAALQSDGTLQFDGTVLMNTFTTAHTGVVFIKEFAPDFSSSVSSTTPIVPGPFSVSHTLTGLGGAVQYGFQVTGVNVWAGDEGPFGNAMITTVPVPEPGSLALLVIGGLGLLRRRRK